MAIIVEDGSIVTDANSYITELELTTYATARGITLVGNTEQLIIKAMDYIEILDFAGTKTLKAQSLQWPRLNVLVDGFSIGVDEIPKELITGVIKTCLKIDEGFEMLPDFEQAIKREKVDGAVEVEYQDGTSAEPYYSEINTALSKLLDSDSYGFQFSVGRG
jgi:hypothetical protein